MHPQEREQKDTQKNYMFYVCSDQLLSGPPRQTLHAGCQSLANLGPREGQRCVIIGHVGSTLGHLCFILKETVVAPPSIS